MFGMQLPGAPEHTVCLKSTGALSNTPRIMELERRCCGLGPKHTHEHAWVSRSVNGKTISLARMAERYPADLCLSLAGLVASVINIKAAAKG